MEEGIMKSRKYGNMVASRFITASRASYNGLLEDISVIIANGRHAVVRRINTIHVVVYWLIGRRIVEFYQQGKERAAYGEEVLIKLSADLKEKHGKGFSVDNLENMRRFYMEFPKMFRISETASRKSSVLNSMPKSEAASRILPWSHYCELLKEENKKARKFYEIETIENNWSIRELKRQMNSMLYERLCLSRDKTKVLALSKKGQLIEGPEDAVKDPYVLEFLGLKEDSSYTEDQLEQAIIDKLQHFLLELGKGFTFVARQKRITIANRHYFIDLVFYNRILKCFVLVDIKRGEFDHADAGQMNFYLNYIKENEVFPGENQPIGLILCAKKDEIFAKYVLGSVNNKIFASKYRLALPSEKEIGKGLRFQGHNL